MGFDSLMGGGGGGGGKAASSSASSTSGHIFNEGGGGQLTGIVIAAIALFGFLGLVLIARK